MAHCGLATLDGVAAMPQLRELHIPYNHIDDLAPLYGACALYGASDALCSGYAACQPKTALCC
jgi:hypothetical protein